MEFFDNRKLINTMMEYLIEGDKSGNGTKMFNILIGRIDKLVSGILATLLNIGIDEYDIYDIIEMTEIVYLTNLKYFVMKYIENLEKEYEDVVENGKEVYNQYRQYDISTWEVSRWLYADWNAKERALGKRIIECKRIFWW